MSVACATALRFFVRCGKEPDQDKFKDDVAEPARLVEPAKDNQNNLAKGKEKMLSEYNR